MSIDFQQANQNKLRSPLLGTSQNTNKNYANNDYVSNITEDFQKNRIIEETLNRAIFKQSKNNTSLNTNNSKKNINEKWFYHLDLLFKICLVFITAIGGLLSLLELFNLISNINSNYQTLINNLVYFACAFIGTILANLICVCYIHLIKTTNYIYLDSLEKNSKLDELFSFIKQTAK